MCGRMVGGVQRADGCWGNYSKAAPHRSLRSRRSAGRSAVAECPRTEEHCRADRSMCWGHAPPPMEMQGPTQPLRWIVASGETSRAATNRPGGAASEGFVPNPATPPCTSATPGCPRAVKGLGRGDGDMGWGGGGRQQQRPEAPAAASCGPGRMAPPHPGLGSTCTCSHRTQCGRVTGEDLRLMGGGSAPGNGLRFSAAAMPAAHAGHSGTHHTGPTSCAWCP